jgi:hypothetical protein
MIFSKHIQAIKGDFMNFAELISFFEEGYAVVQELKANGTLAKLEAAEVAVMAEIHNDPLVQKLYASIEDLLKKNSVVPPKAS